MTPQLKKAFSKDYLMRAWNWLNSSTELEYKNLFRSLYEAYSISSEANINKLSNDLRNGRYQAAHSTKLFIPKKSGILRPISLLNINDQIVYLSLVSVIAEKRKTRAEKNYYKKVFGHLFAGESSIFFYKKWSDGYSKFNNSFRDGFNNGYIWTACFDLTAYYDSIDHKVLRYFLNTIGIEPEFIDFLTNCLEKWTAANDKRIYQGHSIPQGPLASGLLSEVILQFFDDHKALKNIDIKYLRYVDDIRILGRNESDVRKALVELDYISKETGLFPQSSKINIHKIVDIEDEVKSVSLPPEPFNLILSKNQAKVLDRLNKLTHRFKIQNETRFKYVLKHARPSASLGLRLLKILKTYPHLYGPIFRYLTKFPRFTKSISREMLKQLQGERLYDETTSQLLSASMNKIHKDFRGEFKDVCVLLHKNRKKIKSHHLRSMVFVWLLNENYFKFADVQKICLSDDWWVIHNSLDYIDIELYGKPSYETLLNQLLKTESFEVAIRAAFLIIRYDLNVNVPVAEINHSVQLSLKQAAKIGRLFQNQSLVSRKLSEITDSKLPVQKWKRFFGGSLNNLERISLLLPTYFHTDPTKFVNLLDTFNDALCERLFAVDGTIGTYVLGKLGSCLTPTSRFALRFPKFFHLCDITHLLRLQSELSHAVVRRTGQPTRRIKHHELKSFPKAIKEAMLEIHGAI